MGASESRVFMNAGREMAKIAIKILTESDTAPNDQATVRSFVSKILQLPDTTSEEDLERAITEINPNDDIVTNAERFIRAASIYVYAQRDGTGMNADFWLACQECIVKLGFGNALHNFCATPSGDDALHSFCSNLPGCDFYKSVDSAGLELTLWKITMESLKLLKSFLESRGSETQQNTDSISSTLSCPCSHK